MRRILLLILIGGLLAGCGMASSTPPQSTFTPASVVPQTATSVPSAPDPAASAIPASPATAAENTSTPALTNSLPLIMQPAENSAKSTASAASVSESPNNEVTNTVSPTSPHAALAPGAWKDLPVLPPLSPHALSVIRDGIARGNNPRVFSKIGDCESRTTWFLGDFDLDPKNYALGPYAADFQPVIDYYKGSFNRLSMAAKPGFTSASVMSLLWTDRQACDKNETPLACEYRLNKPVLAFIMLGTNDGWHPETFEGHMRKIIEYSLAQGVLPVLGTKADNVEGNESVNATIARLAVEYDVPLWNYWRAVQDLPKHGLQSDGQHLTFGPTRFDDPANMENAWPVRNLNAMQILKMVMEQTQ